MVVVVTKQVMVYLYSFVISYLYILVRRDMFAVRLKRITTF
jgi:hypothetical protein